MNATVSPMFCRSIALAVFLAGAGAITAAEPVLKEEKPGLIGERYIGVLFDYGNVDDAFLEDGLGFTVVYNQASNDELDFSFSLAHMGGDVTDGGDWSMQTGLAGLTYHSALAGGSWFARAEAGLERIKSGDSETEIPFGITLGWERALGKRFAITPYIAYRGYIDSDIDANNEFDFAVLGEWRLRGSLSVLADIGFTDGGGMTASLGGAFRF